MAEARACPVVHWTCFPRQRPDKALVSPIHSTPPSPAIGRAIIADNNNNRGSDNNNNRNRGHTSWVAGAGFGVLTLNSGLAIYRARGDSASILFVAGSYLALLLLFGALREYERAAPGSPARRRARRAVWPLTALLTVGFAWKVAAAMPSAAASALVWGLAVATTVGGFLLSTGHASTEGTAWEA